MNLTLKLQLGFVNLSKRDTSQRETLTNAASKTCGRGISPDTRNAISSPVSADGPTPCASPDGPTSAPFGQVVALASRLARQAKDAGLPTRGTCGPHGSASSASAALQSSLENKLQTRLGGSTLFKETWKRKTTPLGRPVLAHIASAHRISGSDCIGLGTPKVSTGKYSYSQGDHDRVVLSLEGQADLAAWPTPTVVQSGGSPEQHMARKTKSFGAVNPKVTDLALAAEFYLSTWATPTTRDHKDGASDGTAPINGLLGRATGSTAQTGSGGQLNPAHSRWLMGYLTEWDSCGATAMQSCLKSRRNSSARTVTRDGAKHDSVLQ